MFYGAGSLYVVSKDLGADSLRGENILHPLSIASFELAFEDNNIEAKALIDGKRQVVAAAISESIATLTLTAAAIDTAAATAIDITTPIDTTTPIAATLALAGPKSGYYSVILPINLIR